MSPDLAKAVVHDLKNSLGVLEGQLERLAGATPGAAQAHGHCAHLRQRLLGFLLLYAEDSKLKARIDAYHPDDFLAEVRAGFVGSPDIELELRVEPGTAQVWFFDERLVRLALDAALSNAMAFARSKVVLGVRSAPNLLTFYVEDDGPGFGAGNTPGGSGLGTAICESVAKAHHRGFREGRVVCRNAPTGGALFELRLP